MTARDTSVTLAIVVMGVAGSGKTTVGQILADRLGGAFLDADKLHLESNRLKMAGGVPRTDDDRRPWLQEVGRHLAAEQGAARTIVIVCSTLRRHYRDILRDGAARSVLFLHLSGTRELLAERLSGRPEHFMSPALLDSQLETLEPLEFDETGLRLEIASPPDALVDRVATWIRDGGGSS